MIIAVNTVFFPGANSSKENEWTVQYFSRLALQQPDHHFIFISNDKLSRIPAEPVNTSLVITGRPFKSVLGLNFWYNYRLPALLKKIKACVLVNAGGMACTRTEVPQLLMLDNISYLEQPSNRLTKAGRYFKKKLPVFLNRSKTILLSSAYAKAIVARNFPQANDQLKILAPGIGEDFQPIDWEEKESWKEQLAGGKEYFLFAGEVNAADLINLLKAFSLFKKRQKSNMQLLLLTSAGQHAAFREAFKTYKYREEVLLMSGTGNATFQHLVASAYAIVCPANGAGFDPLPLQAMRCATPVIAFNNDALTDLLGDAALFVNPADTQQTANALMLLFKDETERNSLISKGTTLAGTFSWDKSAAGLWQHILGTANQ